MAAITIIDLNIIPCQCVVCDVEWKQARSAKSYGVARYGDLVVPDGYKSKWAGAMVCKPCYDAERRLHTINPAIWISFQDIRQERGEPQPEQ